MESREKDCCTLSYSAGPPLPEHIQAWSLKEALHDRAIRFPDRTAIISAHQRHDPLLSSLTGSICLSDDVTWSYEQLWQGAETLAARLSAFGHQKDDKIVAIVSNQGEWALLLWTALLVGSTFVPLSDSCTSIPQETKSTFKVIGSGTLFVRNSETIRALQNAAPEQLEQFELAFVCSPEAPAGWMSIHDLLSAIPAGSSLDRLQCGDKEDRSQHNDPIMLFSSGTTSFPKAVTHSDEALFPCWSIGESESPPEQTTPRLCVPLPSNHGACLDDILLAWSAGGAVIFPSIAYSAQDTLDAIEKYRATRIMVVPTILRDVLNSPSLVERNLSSLQLVARAGAALPRNLSERIFDKDTGLGAIYMKNAWGMTEAKVVLTAIVKDPEAAGNSSMAKVGTPMPGAKVKICSNETEEIVRRETAGELHVGGPSIARGYLNAESPNFYRDESGEQWIRTGDQAIMDSDGRVTIIGRYKDLIIRGGEKIVPSIIENVLDTVEGVSSQVVGYPDEIAGEVPVYVIKTQSRGPTAEELVSLIRDRLGAMYAPTRILHLSRDLGLQNWPSTASGKPRKAELALHVKTHLQKLESRNGMMNSASSSSNSLAIVKDVWSRVSFIPRNALDDNMEPSRDFADSMMLIQFIHMVKKETSISISMRELKSHRTILQQSKLLVRELGSTIFSKAQSPPAAQSKFHDYGDGLAEASIKLSARRVLAPCGLFWDEDVDQAWPVYDCGAMMLRLRRPQSWNRRHAYATKSSIGELRSALEKSIAVHESFRTFAVHVPFAEEDHDFDAHSYALEGGDLLARGMAFHIAIKPSARFFNLIFKAGFDVGEPCDLANAFHGDTDIDFAAYPGPLTKFFLVNIRSTGTAGVVMLAQHSVLDGVNTHSAFEDDLNRALGGVMHLPPHASYKRWADMYFLHRKGLRAQNGARYFANRLVGAHQAVEQGQLWPNPRASNFFQGYFSVWRDNEGIAQPVGERLPLDGDQRVGQESAFTYVNVQDLPSLTKVAGIPASTIMKAAIAIFNVRMTGNESAILTSANASRSWAFEDDYSTLERTGLPEASDLAGATANFLPNRIDVPPRHSDKTTMAFLRDIQELQDQEAEHMQAPLSLICSLLPPEDAKYFETIHRLQVFNWLPRGARFGMPDPDPKMTHLQRVQIMSRADLGVTWMGGQTDAKTIVMRIVADNCQITRKEMQSATAEVESLIRKLADLANVDRVLWDVIENGQRGACPTDL